MRYNFPISKSGQPLCERSQLWITQIFRNVKLLSCYKAAAIKTGLRIVGQTPELERWIPTREAIVAQAMNSRVMKYPDCNEDRL